MEIKDKLQAGINGLFTGAPDSRAVYELKEELLANSLDRYEDMRQKGMSDEEAYNNVIQNIGNVDELVAALPQDPYDPALREEMDQRRARSALVISLAVGMYIFIAVLIAACNLLFVGTWAYISQLVCLLLCIVPTAMLVYNANRYPKYKKTDDTVVENLKQLNSGNRRSRAILGALSVMLWCIVLTFYFVISFVTYAWHISWIIFLVGGCLQAALVLLVRVKELK